jgi:antitoxin StbD
MDRIYSLQSASITELKRNPSALIRQAGGLPVAILKNNRPSAYLVPAETFETLLDAIEDIELGRLVEARHAEMDQAVSVSPDDL